MYVDELTDESVEVRYISAHTGHELGPTELKHLPLPASVRDEVTLKLCMGIPTERILEGKHMIN